MLEFETTFIYRKVIFYSHGGVDVLTSFLTGAASQPASFFAFTRFGQHRLLLALIDCLWSGVVGVEANRRRFLEAEGVFALLDLLEAAPRSLRAPLLGVLVDLSEEPE